MTRLLSFILIQFVLWSNHLAFAQSPVSKSVYVFEVPKFTAEAGFKKNLRKKLRNRLLEHHCHNVIIATPISTRNKPPWAHHSENWQEVAVISSNCTLIRKPQECPGTQTSKWLYEDMKSKRDWIVCRKL